MAPDHIHVVTCLDHYRRHLTLNHRAGSRRAVFRSQHWCSVHQCPALSSPLGIKSKIATSIGRQEGADCSSHTESISELKGFFRVTQIKEEGQDSTSTLSPLLTGTSVAEQSGGRSSHRITTLEAMTSAKIQLSPQRE